MEFYLSINGEKQGPLNHYKVNELLRSGEVDGDSLIWMRGQDKWEKLRDVPALESSLEQVLNESPATHAENDEDHSDESAGTDREDRFSLPLPDPETTSKISVPVSSEVRPFVRFFARTFDYMLVTVFMWLVSDAAPSPADIDPNLTFGDLITRYTAEFEKEEWIIFARLMFWALLLWHGVEGLLIHVFGTTPGKALFGIKILSRVDGRHPPVLFAIARSFYVYLIGVGLYLFPFSIICMTFGFFRLMATGNTLWDKQLNTQVEHPPLGFVRILLAIGAFFALMIIQTLKFS